MAQMRKPDNIHHLQGTYQRSVHGKASEKLKVDSEIPRMPSELVGKARTEWRRVTKILRGKGLLTLLDRTILFQYCALYGVFANAPAEFNAPEHTQLRMLEQELGFTPSSRGKIVIEQTDDDEYKPISRH